MKVRKKPTYIFTKSLLFPVSTAVAIFLFERHIRDSYKMFLTCSDEKESRRKMSEFSTSNMDYLLWRLYSVATHGYIASVM